MNDNCIFCKIIAGQIPAYVLYENELLIAILDRFPTAPGHTLIIPKRHAQDIFSLTEAEAAAIMPLAKLLAEKIQVELKPDGLNILQNNGRAAGQEVFHYHLHLIPRYVGDGKKTPCAPTDPPLSELEAMAKRLKI